MGKISSFPRILFISLTIAFTAGGGLVACSGSDESNVDEAPVASATSLARSVEAVGAEGRALGLTRVEIPAGAEIPPHFHEGTQLAYIEAGTLTYTVETGKVTVMTGPSDDAKVVRDITAGQTAEIEAGQWIAEQPDEQHQARNDGDEGVLIYLSNLIKEDAEASTPVP